MPSLKDQNNQIQLSLVLYATVLSSNTVFMKIKIAFSDDQVNDCWRMVVVVQAPGSGGATIVSKKPLIIEGVIKVTFTV